MKRLLASVLALAMVLAVCLMAGCDKDPVTTTTESQKAPETTTANQGGEDETTTANQGGEDETTTVNQVGDGETTTESTPVGGDDPEVWDPIANPKAKLPGYEDVDFRGAVINFLGYKDSADGYDNEREVYSDGIDAISVAANTRVQLIETNYKCDIVFTGSDDPNKLFTAATTGGQKVDLYSPKYGFSIMATSGNYYNLASLDIDLTADYWDQNYVKSYLVKNSAGADTLYNVTGDFVVSSYTSTHILMFNTKLYDMQLKNDFGSIYDLVKEGKWTMDVFAQMIDKGAREASGNSEYKVAEGDILGWITTGHATHGLHTAAAMPMISVENGKFTYAIGNNIANYDAVVTKSIEIWSSPKHQTLGYNECVTYMISGNAIFYSEILAKAEEDSFKNASEFEMSLVPYPKHFETQTEYAHYVDNHFLVYGIPAMVANVDEIADFFSIYAAYSTAMLRPAVIDAYSYDYFSGAESAVMLDLVLKSRTYDPGYLAFAYEGYVSDMITTGKNMTSMMVGRRATEVENKITDFIKGIDANKT